MQMHKHRAIILLENPAQHKCAISFDWQWNIHLTGKILGDKGQHECMIPLDREWYVHVKMVIFVPRKKCIRKFHGQK